MTHAKHPGEPLQTAHDSLDPADWQALRTQAHAMLDDILDYQQRIRVRPVWQTIPDELRLAYRQPLSTEATPLDELHRQFMHDILPYAVGNAHPGFMGWVHGGGTPVGMLAEMLSAGLNANLGGRDHMPVELERQMVRWVRDLFDFPAEASGLFVSGTSMANLLGLLVARQSVLPAVRTQGIEHARLVAYTSSCAHVSLKQAMEIAGLGNDNLRQIPIDADFRMDVTALRNAIAADRAAGLTPFFIAGTAGTVNTGAIDDLNALADLAADEKLWLHVDGAFGALAKLSPELAPLLSGIERADSLAFDFHKWGQVPYDAGFILVRDGRLHLDTFAAPAAYLQREARGMAANSPWPCDYGPELSRSFRALKTWFTLRSYGAGKIGASVAHTCEVARHLRDRIAAEPTLELMAPVALNIVCFRYRADDALNQRILVAVQESGIAAPSSTHLNGRFAIRAAIVNHRTTASDVDAMLEAVLRYGNEFTGVT